MSEDYTIRGAEDFIRLSKALKAAGADQFRKELHAELRKAVRAGIPKTDEKLREVLPSGLKSRGSTSQSVQLRTGANPGVSAVISYGRKAKRNGLGASNARMLNNYGQIRHPVRADPQKTRKQWRWVDQSIPGATDWFGKAWQEQAPSLQEAVEAAIEALATKIVNQSRG